MRPYRVMFGVSAYIETHLTDEDAEKVAMILDRPHPRVGRLCITNPVGLKTIVATDDIIAIQELPPALAS